jgi:hypothetical protein
MNGWNISVWIKMKHKISNYLKKKRRHTLTFMTLAIWSFRNLHHNNIKLTQIRLSRKWQEQLLPDMDPKKQQLCMEIPSESSFANLLYINHQFQKFHTAHFCFSDMPRDMEYRGQLIIMRRSRLLSFVDHTASTPGPNCALGTATTLQPTVPSGVTVVRWDMSCSLEFSRTHLVCYLCTWVKNDSRS